MIIIEKDVKKNVLTVRAISGGQLFILGVYDLNEYHYIHKQLEDKVIVCNKDNIHMATFNVDAYTEV